MVVLTLIQAITLLSFNSQPDARARALGYTVYLAKGFVAELISGILRCRIKSGMRGVCFDMRCVLAGIRGEIIDNNCKGVVSGVLGVGVGGFYGLDILCITTD